MVITSCESETRRGHAPCLVTFGVPLLLVAGLCACTTVQGLSASKGTPTAADAPPGQITPLQLQTRLMGFADRYLNRISEGVDRVAAGVNTPEGRVAAQATKYYPGLTVVSVVAGPDPEATLRDLLIVVTLERMVWADGWAREVFGAHADALLAAQQDVEADIWALADSVMRPDQVRTMRELIVEWRRQHPGHRYVSSMRFDDVAKLAHPDQVAPVAAGFLAPISEATRTVEATRLLGERAVFLGSHMPLLVLWEAELLLHETAAKPETQQLVRASTDLQGTAQRLATVVEHLPRDVTEQRIALLHELEQSQGALRQMVGDVQGGLRDARAVVQSGRELVAAVQQTVTATDQLMGKWNQGSSPGGAAGTALPAFDVREVTQAATQLAATLRELQQVLTAGQQVAASPVWGDWMGRIEALADRRVASAREAAETVVRQLFWRGLALIAVSCFAGFATSILFRWVTHRHGLVRS